MNILDQTGREKRQPHQAAPICTDTHQMALNQAHAAESEQLVPIRVGQLFADQVAPLLAACKNFSLDRSSVLPQSLLEGLTSAQTRAIAWGHLSNNGLQTIQTQSQRHALMVGLLPYVTQDGDACWPGFVAAAVSAAQAADNQLYQLLGECALKQGFSNRAIFALGESFAALSTHNAARDGALKPWIELFSKRGNEQLYCALINEVLYRIERGELSSYDHILTVLCSSPSSEAIDALARGLNQQPAAGNESIHVRLGLGTVMSVYFQQTLSMVPFCAALCLLQRNSPAGMLLSALTAAVIAGAVRTHFELRKLAAKISDSLEQEIFLERSPHYMYFAEKVYGKLLRQNEPSQAARQLRKEMESHPVFVEHVARWQTAGHLG